MSNQAVYKRISFVTDAILGHPIPPHLFRDCLFTTIAEAAPEQIQIGSRLLGHRSPATGEKHYNQAQGLVAQRQHHALVKKLRRRKPAHTLEARS